MANSVTGRCRIWQFLKSEPYSLAVLYAKVSALINRSRGNVLSSDKLIVGNIALQLSSQQVFVDGREVDLTPKEYALLQ